MFVLLFNPIIARTIQKFACPRLLLCLIHAVCVVYSFRFDVRLKIGGDG